MFIIQCPILWYAKVCTLPSARSSFIINILNIQMYELNYIYSLSDKFADESFLMKLASQWHIRKAELITSSSSRQSAASSSDHIGFLWSWDVGQETPSREDWFLRESEWIWTNTDATWWLTHICTHFGFARYCFEKIFCVKIFIAKYLNLFFSQFVL